MVKLNILKKPLMVLLTKATSIYFVVNPSEFSLPVTGSKIEIDECTLLGSSRAHVGAKQIFVKLFATFTVH